jgi:hypothetical protein
VHASNLSFGTQVAEHAMQRTPIATSPVSSGPHEICAANQCRLAGRAWAACITAARKQAHLHQQRQQIRSGCHRLLLVRLYPCLQQSWACTCMYGLRCQRLHASLKSHSLDSCAAQPTLESAGAESGRFASASVAMGRQNACWQWHQPTAASCAHILPVTSLVRL